MFRILAKALKGIHVYKRNARHSTDENLIKYEILVTAASKSLCSWYFKFITFWNGRIFHSLFEIKSRRAWASFSASSMNWEVRVKVKCMSCSQKNCSLPKLASISASTFSGSPGSMYQPIRMSTRSYAHLHQVRNWLIKRHLEVRTEQITMHRCYWRDGRGQGQQNIRRLAAFHVLLQIGQCFLQSGGKRIKSKAPWYLGQIFQPSSTSVTFVCLKFNLVWIEKHWSHHTQDNASRYKLFKSVPAHDSYFSNIHTK